MIGLTAGLVIEGQTGKSILTQVNLLCSCMWPLSLCAHECGLSHTQAQ